MLFSKTCIYGIRAAMYVALINKQDYVSIRSIADQLNISFHFLTKILQVLSQKKIMTSYRGPNGGVALVKSPEETYLIEIIEAIDGPKLFTECILGLPGCGTNKPCPIHDEWAEMREELHRKFKALTLSELVMKVNVEGARLSDSAFDVTDLIEKL